MAEFDTPEPIDLVIELVVGDVLIAAGDRPDTVVEVRPRDSARRADVRAAEQTRVDYSAGTLLVKATQRWRSYSPFSDGGGVDVQIELPTGSRVTGEAAVGGFRCTGSLGDCRFKTSVGDIHLERATAITLNTGVGDISVQRASGDAEIGTGSGTVRVGELDGAAVIKNSNGDCRVAEITGDLRVKAANGDIAIEQLHASLTAKTANGDINVGGVRRGSVVAETGLGAVGIAIVDGTAAWLDLRTGYGSLHNTLEAGPPPQPGDPTVEVRARSGYGDITVRRAGPRRHTERR
jgi:DUF4097 and DUF4098 domain-containing protein YvlB